jgi:5'-methylthioadenosine phosphorylase
MTDPARPVLGIIGGSGVYDLPGLEDRSEEAIASPWGEPSDVVRLGRIGDTAIAFLSRHGQGHRLSPSGINYRANIDCLKRAGVTHLVTLSAVGSYREGLAPGQFVLPDQFIDRTVQRESSFFGNGCVAHVPFSHPVSPTLAALVAEAAAAEGIPLERGGTAVCMEGPQFSTLAESLAYKAQGFDIIGMTSMPEAKLAREAELPYCMVAMVTDYDCWHPHHDSVDVQSVLKVMADNTAKARRLVARLARDFPAAPPPCAIRSDRALDGAIMTAPQHRDPELMRKLAAITRRVLSQ